MQLTLIDDEPRVLDLDLGTSLGLRQPRNIRPLIKAKTEELQTFGNLHTWCANSLGRGRPSLAFYLNRQQALLLCILSDTRKAKEVRAEVIRHFDAYKPSIPTPRTYLDALKALIAAEEDKTRLAEQLEELNSLTVDEYRALKHESWSRRKKIMLGLRASMIARRERISLVKQSREFLDFKTKTLKTSAVNVYPRTLLDRALTTLGASA